MSPALATRFFATGKPGKPQARVGRFLTKIPRYVSSNLCIYIVCFLLIVINLELIVARSSLKSGLETYWVQEIFS